MGFDAAGVRGASAGLGALARRAGANGEALLRAAHDACKLPEDRIAGGFRSAAASFLGSPEGKAALGKAFEAGWALLRGIVGSASASGASQPAHGAPPPPPPAQAAAVPERPGPIA
jgi:hypothetical protein